MSEKCPTCGNDLYFYRCPYCEDAEEEQAKEKEWYWADYLKEQSTKGLNNDLVCGIVCSIFHNLIGRCGFDEWWAGIDNEIQKEILDDLINDVTYEISQR